MYDYLALELPSKNVALNRQTVPTRRPDAMSG